MFIFSFFFYDAASTQIYPHLHTLSLHDALPSFAAILDVLAAAPPEAAILARCADIDRLFAADTVEEIFAALAADGGDWAAGQRALLETKSPQTMKVSTRLLPACAHILSFPDGLAREYAGACRTVPAPHFLEGAPRVVP